MHRALVPRHERRLRRHAQTECRRRKALRPGHWRALRAQCVQGPCLGALEIPTESNGIRAPCRALLLLKLPEKVLHVRAMFSLC